jgi:protein-S-isoprenylcysteine O-methyltransferase Ste14
VTRLFAAVRSLLYAVGFVLLWGWLSLSVRDLGGFGTWQLGALWRVVGIAFLAAGGALVLWCVVAFVSVGRGTPAPFDAPRFLVPGGPYRWVRNPMYLGLFLALTGFGLWHRSPAMVLFVIPVALALHLFVLFYEEPTLTRRFGADYEAYRARVHRWIPALPQHESGVRA